MTETLRIGLAGLGTVGAGVALVLRDNAEAITARAGKHIEIAAVSARDRHKDRGVDLSHLRWFEDAADLAHDPHVDVVVELIGGSDGVARHLAEAAFASGKHLVTANKALLAHHGVHLAAMAEARGLTLAYEAAVAGGIPIIKAIREGLAANRIGRVYGILNGTCNYILSTMEETGRDFADVLAEAQALGYAEADPSFDVDGIDTAHKLAVLTGLAFGAKINFDAVHVEGIRSIKAIDIQYARELGYRIKLLGQSRLTPAGIEQRVHPAMVALANPIAHVNGSLNAVVTESDFAGRSVFEGRGAGAGPTASAVVADLIDIARGRNTPVFAVPAAQLADPGVSPMERHEGAYYVRLHVTDKPGVLANVTAIMRDELVSVESLIQRGRSPGEGVQVVITTHDATEAHMRRALLAISALDAILEPPTVIRIEQL